MKKNVIFLWGLIMCIISISNSSCSKPKSLFSKENITPWCIVPFDLKQRNPGERAEMLQELGFKTLAYDWRDKNIPEFDEEIIQLKRRGIVMNAFWWSGGFPKSKEDFLSSEKMQTQVNFLKRNNLKLEVWISSTDRNLEAATDDAKYEELAFRVDILATELKKLGCSLGLYNHGGWGGEPYNMIEILKRAKSENTGIVYNFHHAHEHLEMMPAAFNAMVPYLYCVNLNGMNKGGPKILPLGEGAEDLAILKMINESGYKGRIGIIGHIDDEDVEIVLKRNIEGLKKLLYQMGDTEALNTYN